MAVMPGASWRPLPENATQAAIRPTQLILHTAVDAPGPTRLERYFARQDVGVESHFWVTLSGEIVQMMDTEVRADANRTANRRPDGTGAISVETEDEGDPVGVPWTPAQIESIVQIALWANERHGVPVEVCPAPSAPGIGYHAMWGAPSAWTPTRGKTCPGATRVDQFYNVVMPALVQAKEGANMSMSKDRAVKTVATMYRAILHREPDSAGLAHWSAKLESGELSREGFLWAFLEGAAPEVAGLRTQVKAMSLGLDVAVERIEALESAAPGSAISVDAVIEEILGRLEE